MEHILLLVVERDSLVEQMEPGGARVHKGELFHFFLPYFRGLRQGNKLSFVYFRPSQETGIAVVVVQDDLEEEEVGLAVVAGKFEEQTVLVVQFGPVVAGVGHFFYLRAGKITGAEVLDRLVEAPLDF